VKAVGPLVIFTNDSPMPNLPSLLASDQFLIALTTRADGKTSGAIGTGPFQVTGFNNGILALAANENCWSGRPFADAVEVRVHRAVRDQWLDLSLGHADVVEIPAEQFRQAQQQHLSVHASLPLTLLALQVNDTGALANVKLRDLQETDKALINYEPEAYTPAIGIKVTGKGEIKKVGGDD